MKKLINVVALMALLIIGAVSTARADFLTGHGDILAPSNQWTLIITIDMDGSFHVFYEYWNVSQITYADGTVQSLDTSDGSNYILDVEIKGSRRILTKRIVDATVFQWIADPD